MALSNVINIAGTGMNAQSIRLNTTASNIANAQTVSSSVEETYRARKPIFQLLQKQFHEFDDNFREVEYEGDVGNGVSGRYCGKTGSLGYSL